jgi:hypothetical protein
LKAALGDRAIGIPINNTPEYEPYMEETMSDPLVTQEADEYDLDTYHKQISARELLPRGDERAPAKVIKRKIDEDGKLIGTAHAIHCWIQVFMKSCSTMGRLSTIVLTL